MVISTGKADWPREVTDESRSLANLLSYVSSSSSVPNQEVTYYPPSKPSTRIAILNGSHKSHEDDSHRVIVLPDYKVVEHIPASKQGAESLYKRALDASLTRIGATTSQSSEEESSILSYPLPYACVIMICACLSEAFTTVFYGINAVFHQAPIRGGTIDVTLQLPNSRLLSVER